MIRTQVDLAVKQLTVWTLLAAGVCGSARGVAIFEADMADFYQHQKSYQNAGIPQPPMPAAPGYANPNWWNGGWCLTTAWTDVMYHWSRKGAAYVDLFDHAGIGVANGINHGANGLTWIDRHVFTNEALLLGTDIRGNPLPNAGFMGCASSQRVNEYVQANAAGNNLEIWEVTWGGPGVGKVVYDNITTGVNNIVTPFNTMFDFYAAYLPSAASVMLRIEPPDNATNGTPWWGWHAIPGAGVDAAERKIWYADPDNTPHGSGWGASYEPGDPLPVGTLYYGSGRVAGAGGAEKFTTGPFTGSRITDFWVMVPEPGGMVIVLTCVLAALAVRRRDGAGI